MSDDKYSMYCDQLKEAKLELVEDGQAVKTFLLRQKPDSMMMSAYIFFTPAGIVITGDLRVTGHGVIAPGYGLSWFADHLDPRYLAEKFLKERWDPETARNNFKEWADYLEEEINAERDRAKQELTEDYPEDGITLDMINNAVAKPYRRVIWFFDAPARTGYYGSQADAIRRLVDNVEAFNSAQELYEALPGYYEGSRLVCPFDGDDLSKGYDYPEHEIGWLVAIQRRFAECYAEMEKSPCSAK